MITHSLNKNHDVIALGYGGEFNKGTAWRDYGVHADTSEQAVTLVLRAVHHEHKELIGVATSSVPEKPRRNRYRVRVQFNYVFN